MKIDSMNIQTYKTLPILSEQATSGYGILLEHDAGLISPTLDLNVGIIREMKEQLTDYSQPLYVYATLQKYDSENRNGRIYPEDILRREVERYQKIIDMNASFHELDHPECQRVTAEILTLDGWKYIKDIAHNEVVITLNKSTGVIEPQMITKKIDQPYKGKMISIVGRNIDVLVTPNHRFVLVNKRSGKSDFYTAQDILDNKVSLTEHYIPKLGNWSGEYQDVITIPSVPATLLHKNLGNDLRTKYSTDLQIDAEIFYAFMGIYLSEGHCIGTKGYKKGGFKVSITQKKSNSVEAIRKLLQQMPFEWKENDTNGKIQFYVNDARLHNYLSPLGHSHTKHIPYELKQASPHLLQILMDWFLVGDGRTRKSGNWYAKEVFSTSKHLIDDLHEILIKSGGSGNVRMEERNIDRYITDDNGTKRLIKGENSQPMHFLHLSTTQGLWLDKRFVSFKEVDYEGNVYSVSVPNETYYTRDNGKAFWSGNSSVVSLTKGSPHRIVEMFWKGNVLIGKLEILVSRGWREHGGIYCGGDMVAHYLSYGMTLGVSSRGVGSLSTVNGRKMVQQDFELICFDVVSSPSTPGSYIYKDLNDFSKYDEKLVQSIQKQSAPPTPQNLRDARKESMMNRLNQFLNVK